MWISPHSHECEIILAWFPIGLGLFSLSIHYKNIHLKELEEASTEFSAKYKISTIYTIYFSKDFISLREGKEMEKEEVCKYFYWLSLWVRNCARYFVYVLLQLSFYTIFLTVLRDRYCYCRLKKTWVFENCLSSCS